MCEVRNRVLRPGLGWLQRDPLRYVDSTSLYEYVRCNPVSRVDPSGEANPSLAEKMMGAFEVSTGQVKVIDPAQQKLLGNVSWGYTVKYTPEKGYRPPPRSRVILVQAVRSRGFVTGIPARFDFAKKTEYDHDMLPEYPGQKPFGSLSLRDRPFNPRLGLGWSKYHWWDNTICAVCQTANPGEKEYSEVILGCISFDWFDEPNKAELHLSDGTTIKDGTQKAAKPISAAAPDTIWDEALERWNRETEENE